MSENNFSTYPDTGFRPDPSNNIRVCVMFEHMSLTLRRHQIAAKRRWTNPDLIEAVEVPSHG